MEAKRIPDAAAVPGWMLKPYAGDINNDKIIYRARERGEVVTMNVQS